MSRVERVLWRQTYGAGVGYAATGLVLGAMAGKATGSTAAAVEIAAAGRMLRQAGADIGVCLRDGDLAGARVLLPTLCGRDPDDLDSPAIAAAVIESLAENLVDAVVAPALWGLIGGAPGALAHRAVNTMDAMVGHRSERYERFGWASARADDVAAYLPARATAALVAVVRPTRSGAVWSTVRRDGPRHPSPNAGVAEAAFAGVLGVELGGPLRYGGRLELRPTLGRGPRPIVYDIERAVALADDIERALVAGLLGLAAVAAIASRRSSHRRRVHP